MSEQKPHRRRRPQQAVLPEEPQPPRRIIVSSGDDEPDWLISNVSGAASRRAKSAEPKEPAKPQRESGAAYAAVRSTGQKKAEPKAAASSIPEEPKVVRGKAPRREAPRETVKKQPIEENLIKIAPPRTAARSAGPAQKARSSAKMAKKPARKPSRKARERRMRQIRTTVVGVLCAAVVITLLCVAVIGGGRLVDIKKTLDQGDGVFYSNISVNDIPLGGMSLDQAEQVVTAQVENLISSWKITLRTQDGRTWDITGKDLNMQYDVADQLDQLWSIGHTGSSSTRYEQVKALWENPEKRYTTLTYDMSMVTQIFTQIKSEVDRSAVSATRVYDDTKWPPYSYTDDVPGQQLDITGLNEKICDMVDRLESGVVDLTPTSVQAPITREYLEGQIVKLATYETAIAKSGNYAENRHENIRIGTEKFNHLTIKAGESVSFNKVTGKRSAQNGYQISLELAYGKYVEGYGGGICQVSSTLYNAVVAAGLEVSTRSQHSLASSYVPMGLDATVSDDRLDFVFKNNTGADIFIETNYYQKKDKYYYCQFTIYGRPDPNGYTYKLESQVRETLPIPEPTYKPDKEAKYVVYDDEMHQTSKGSEGYVVDVYLVTMDANGLEVSRTLDHTDTYKATQPVYYVGVTPKETPTPVPATVD